MQTILEQMTQKHLLVIKLLEEAEVDFSLRNEIIKDYEIRLL